MSEPVPITKSSEIEPNPKGGNGISGNMKITYVSVDQSISIESNYLIDVASDGSLRDTVSEIVACFFTNFNLDVDNGRGPSCSSNNTLHDLVDTKITQFIPDTVGSENALSITIKICYRKFCLTIVIDI